MTVHVATVVPSRYKDHLDTWNTPEFTDDVAVIRLKARHQSNRVCTWHVLYVGPEGECRRVQGGPIVPGPYAALICEATCIHSGPATPGERAREELLVEGDIVEVRGTQFRIDDTRGRYGYNPELVLVEA